MTKEEKELILRCLKHQRIYGSEDIQQFNNGAIAIAERIEPERKDYYFEICECGKLRLPDKPKLEYRSLTYGDPSEAKNGNDKTK